MSDAKILLFDRFCPNQNRPFGQNFVRTWVETSPDPKILSEPSLVSNHQFKGGKSSDEHVGGGIGAFDGFWHLKGLNAARRALTTDIGEVSYREVSSLTCRFLSELRLGFRLRRPDFVRTRGVSFWDFGPKFCPNLRQTSPPILGGPQVARTIAQAISTLERSPGWSSRLQAGPKGPPNMGGDV
ncbi:hypothetical protein K435DRAFT_924533 [Dendrothele bispora CBS 962.96]|uniref:Uncharacterized protein n=1 Tax=Dendrothele bispora (strain CBS 962.96) TaxID=1314807 RepID=A0A4S8LAJ6_DENBC|nr:hypothetical protein K435DRAFT_924533 [Dendrothele bispora CBS 962.96]